MTSRQPPRRFAYDKSDFLILAGRLAETVDGLLADHCPDGELIRIAQSPQLAERLDAATVIGSMQIGQGPAGTDPRRVLIHLDRELGPKQVGEPCPAIKGASLLPI